MKIFKLTFLACVLVMASSVSFADGSMAKLEKSVVELNLPNGMKWLLLNRGATPVFAGAVQVKVGGVDEEVGKTGLAHMLEHMAFKGTKDISSDDLWNAFMTNGAEGLNAFTTKDVTAYHAKMPSSKMELWLYLNSEMIKHSVMRDFFKERDVVTEELMNSVENNPNGRMFHQLFATAFTKSPYRWDIIGEKADVMSLQPEYLEAFKKKYYVPERMVGVLVGGFDIAKAKVLIGKYFGDIPAKKSAAEKFPKEPEQSGTRRDFATFNASPVLMMAYHKPTLPSHDDYTFDLINYVLCEGENSRLRSELVFNKKLVRAVECGNGMPGARLDNLFIIVAEPIKGHSYEDVEAAIDAELGKLKNGDVDEKEMARARNNVAKDMVFEMSSNEEIAMSLAYYQSIAGDWRYIMHHFNVIKKIDSKELSKVANKYFTDNNKIVIELKK